MRSSFRKRLIYPAVGFLALGVAAFGGLSLVNTISPAGIVIHHSAIPPRPDGGQIDAKLIDEFHRKRGYNTFYWGRFYHIGYHYVILPNGKVERGRPEHCKGAHTTGYNSYVGICLVGDFSSRDNPSGERGLSVPTDAQIRALTQLSQTLRARYEIPVERIVRHDTLDSNSECPGDRFPFDAFVKALK